MSTDSSAPSSFSFSERIVILLIVESASVSALTVTCLLLYIAYISIASRKWSMETHIHYYFLNLLVSDLIEALGNILSVKWIHDAKITEGALCTAQGVVKQTGNVGVALTTLAIAIHTLCIVVFHCRSRPETALIVITVIWVFIALIVGIGASTHKHYYGNTQYWCWINNVFHGQQIGLEYVWYWLTASISILIYVFLALVIKGIVIVDNGKILWRQARGQKPAPFTITQESRESQNSVNAIAMSMLFYPAVYIITILPQSIVRCIYFFHPSAHIPMSWSAICGVLFASSGVLNVILYTVTRPKLLRTRNPHFSTFSSVQWQKPSGSHGPFRDESYTVSSWEENHRGQAPAIDEVVDIRRLSERVRHPQFPITCPHCISGSV